MSSIIPSAPKQYARVLYGNSEMAVLDDMMPDLDGVLDDVLELWQHKFTAKWGRAPCDDDVGRMVSNWRFDPLFADAVVDLHQSRGGLFIVIGFFCIDYRGCIRVEKKYGQESVSVDESAYLLEKIRKILQEPPQSSDADAHKLRRIQEALDSMLDEECQVYDALPEDGVLATE